MHNSPLSEDRDYVLAHTHGLWDELRGQRVFITGGTGFVGTWLLHVLTWASDELNLGVSINALSRDPGAFRNKVPQLASHRAITFLQGDIRSFPFPAGQFSYVIHAANDPDFQRNAQDPLLMVDIVIGGTRRVLEMARQVGCRKFLFTSTGAIYGNQPLELTHIPETYTGSPGLLDDRATYREAKRMAEVLCAAFWANWGLQSKIARCFAFVGPYLPLDVHFAIGNFIGDALAGRPITVTGDGTPIRSYLYAADMAIWLWTILLRGQSCHPYNVGSPDPITIADTARAVGNALTPPQPVRILGQPTPSKPPHRYVPDCTRAREELGLRRHIALSEALCRTIHWHSAQPL